MPGDAPVSGYLTRRVRSRQEVMLLSALKRVILETPESSFSTGAWEQANQAIGDAEKAT